MGLRLYKDDFTAIFHYLGALVSGFSFLMLVPLLMALIAGEYSSICNFLLSFGITLGVGSLMRICTGQHGTLTSKRAMILVALVWIFAMFAGAIPLYLSGHYSSYLDCTVEAMSGLTTTGFSMASNVDHMPLSVNMWRFLMHFVGGQGVLVAAISLGLLGSKSGSASVALYNSEGRSDQILPSIKDTSRFIWRTSLVILLLGTVALTTILFIASDSFGYSLLQGFWLTMSAFDTGGFAPQSTSAMFYHCFPLEVALSTLTLVGCISFLLYADINRGDRFELLKNSEVRALALWISLMVLIAMSSLAVVGSFKSLPALIRRGIFTVISAETTSGFSVLYTSQTMTLASSGAIFALILAMAVGGGTGSTAGGIKAMRVDIMFRSLVHHVKIALLPDHSVSDVKMHHVHRKSLSSDAASMAFTIALLYIITYAIGTVAGILAGYDAIPAMFESVSAASNAGATSGVLNASTPSFLKVIYIVEMLAGRLEFMTLLAMIAAMLASMVPRRAESWAAKRKERRRAKARA